MSTTSAAGIRVRRMASGDWGAVERIYGQGIATGNATFESQVPTQADFLSRRISELCLVAEDSSGTIVGWAAASLTSPRAAYRGVVEHSLYVDGVQSGRGIATLLLENLISTAREQGYWTIQSAIFTENVASRALHVKAGFREIGRRERISLMNHGPWAGQWRDTFLYELRL